MRGPHYPGRGYRRCHVPQHHHAPWARAGGHQRGNQAAARQYVRKVSGVQTLSPRTEAAFELAVRKVAEATTELLAGLPPRTQPPPTLPPLRRIAARRAAG